MADQKVSELTELAAGGLDPSADWLLVSDMSDLTSKKMKPSEMIRASLPYLSTFWDFTTGTLLPTVSFTRASTGWRWNSSGVLVPETTNAARFQYDRSALTPRGLLVEPARTNMIRNSVASGAVPGTPGTAPTNWPITTTGNGITREIVGTGTEDGIDYLEVRYYGTAVAGGNVDIFGDLKTQAPAVAGQTWTGGFFLRLMSGSWANTTPLLWMIECNSGGSTIGTPPTKSAVPTSAALKTQFYYQTHTLVEATAAYITQLFAASYNAGAVIDFTVRVGLPQLAQAAAVTMPIKTTGAAAVACAADQALITNPQVLADQCYIVKARTPISAISLVSIVFQVDDGTINNRRVIYYTSGRLYVSAMTGGVAQAALDLGAVANDTDFVVAARFADNNFAASLNGGAIVTDMLGTNPLGLTTAKIGASGTTNAWNSTIRSLETRRTATDAELPLLAA